MEDIIAQIDAELALLYKAKELLMDDGHKESHSRLNAASKPSAAKKRTKRRTLSAAARERIRQAQLKRWAAVKKQPKKATK